QGVRVVQRPAAHAGTGEDQAVAQQVHALNAEAAELGRPQEAAQVPAGLREVGVGVAATGLENADLVALLHEAQRRDAPTETRSDDQDVVVRDPLLTHGTSSGESCYRQVCTSAV